MLAKFKKHIEDKFPELLESSILLACSGGVDSVVLVHLCESIKLNYAIAHCNFRLRGEESDKDEKLVEELANKFGVEYHVTHFDTIGYVNKNKVSVQMAARELRYAWFAELMAEKHYDYVVTAHHADDTLETFIINLSRGTGIEGLMGIPASSSTVMRPLLIFSRKDILDYAREKNIIWREDPSNEDLKYLRNKIRHQIVPVLKELHPTFDKNFAKTLEHLAGTSSLVDQHIQDLKNEFFQVQEGHIRISVASLRALRPLKPYIYAIFRDYGFTAWDDVLGLLTSGSGKEVRSATHRLIKDREVLLLEPLASKRSFEEEYFIDDANARLPIKLELETVDKMEDIDKSILYVDKETLNQRLLVRKWKNGDYFYPLGMKGRKKVSKFFKDEKMDLLAKERQWLLCSGGDIVWIIGKRADDRFKVGPETETILKITWVA